MKPLRNAICLLLMGSPMLSFGGFVTATITIDEKPVTQKFSGDTPDSTLRKVLTQWLGTNPRIADAMQLEKGMGYSKWPEVWKAQLETDFVDLWKGKEIQITDPMVNHANYAIQDDQTVPQGEYLNADVWRLYVNLMANSLVVEIRQDTKWSVLDFSDTSIEGLFNGRHIFRHQGWTNLTLPTSFNVPSLWLTTTSLRANKFNKENQILAETQLETVGRAISWTRENLIHYGYISPSETERDLNIGSWGYDGPSPIVVVMDGRVRTGSVDTRWSHITAGCHGTLGLLMSVLRAVNIPVVRAEPKYKTEHTLPRFPSIGLNLSHGDDPYSTRGTTQPWPITELLIDDKTFDTWFLNVADPEENVGKQAEIIDKKYE